MPRNDWLDWEGPADKSLAGCSLGNPDCFLRTDLNSGIEGLWLAALDRWYAGQVSFQPPDGFTLDRLRYEANGQVSTFIRGNEKLQFSIHIPDSGAAATLEVSGESLTSEIVLELDWRAAAAASAMHRKQPGRDVDREWSFSASKPGLLKAAPLDGPDRQWLTIGMNSFEVEIAAPSRVRLKFKPDLGTHGSFKFSVTLTVTPDENLPADSKEPESPALLLTVVQERKGGRILPTAAERALAWCKISSHRVWHQMPGGDWAFTNDPPGVTVVTRDAAWFVLGADHFAPEWSRELLLTLLKHVVAPFGKTAEYVALIPSKPYVDDYHLNINDAAPLLLIALEHHLSGKGYPEADRIEKMLSITRAAGLDLYAQARSIANWILEQQQADGLVSCNGAGVSVYGTAGWRNIIPGYRISGCVTELNALCVAALRSASRLMKLSGDAVDAIRFAQEAERLSEAMVGLVDSKTGLFLLTRDLQTRQDHTLSVDLLFPALCHAGPEEARMLSLNRLKEADFYGPQGLLTMPSSAAGWHPSYGYGLMGGSWPNATAWAAAAFQCSEPELASKLALRLGETLFPESWAPGSVGAPGQFTEWYDGNTGKNQGMMLSPWMPATYVWLMEEGLQSGGI